MLSKALEKEESGNLRATPLVTIALALLKQKPTAALTISGNGGKRIVFFEQGVPVAIQSDFKEDHLLNILLAKEKIKKSQGQEIVQRVKTENKKINDLLVEMQVTTAKELPKLLTLVAQEKLARCFALLEADYRYQEAALPAGLAKMPLSLIRGLFDGVRAYYSLDLIQTLIPKLIPENTARLRDGQQETLEKLPVLPEERGVISILNDYPVIGELAKASYVGELQVYRTLFVFCLLQIIDLETPGDRQDREMIETLSKEERARREIIDRFYRSLNEKNYFEIFNLAPTAENMEVEKTYRRLCKEYPAEEIGRYFTGSRYDLPEQLHSKLLAIKEILIDPDKRREYVTYLQSGKRGDFGAQSNILNAEKKYREGLAEFQRKNFPRALQLLQEASTINPRDARILADLGWAYILLSAKNPPLRDEAINCLQRSIAADPQEYRPYLYWGTLAKKEGREEEAKAFFRETLLRNPGSEKAYLELNAYSAEVCQRTILEGMYEGLSRWDYYEILRVPRTAKPEEIKKSYYKLSKQFHPDKFYAENGREDKDKAKAIYKRLVEAYMVLRNPYKRREYDQELIAQRGAAGGVRLKDAADVIQRKEKREVAIENAQAKRFYELALTALSQGNVAAAKTNLKLAINTDPENEFLQEKLEDILRGEKGGAVEASPEGKAAGAEKEG